MINRVYNSKILLFGEYLVIHNSKALTIPFSHFNGKFSDLEECEPAQYKKAINSNTSLRKFLEFLLQNRSLSGNCNLDLVSFKQDIDRGLYFKSNIPQGYGVGSSGALVASVYEKYCENPLIADNTTAILKLKKILSSMETYFHGTSSGMDPLSCYIGKPLLFEGKEDARKVNVPHQENNDEGSIFLVDTGFPGSTEPLVNLFLSKCRKPEYLDEIINRLIPLANSCIDCIVNGEIRVFFSKIKLFSELQLYFFREMIPDSFFGLWEKGIHGGNYYLKLCGSGGGGFLLGFTHDYSLAQMLFRESGRKIIPVFKNLIKEDGH